MTTSAGAPALPFVEVTALTVAEAGLFRAEVSPEWTIGGKPNGGYLLAMLGRAAASMSRHEHVIAASAHYLHPPEPGPVMIAADLLRAGRSASQVRTQMQQDGRACVEALLTVSRLDRATAAYWDRGTPDISRVPYEEGIPLVPLLPNGMRVAIMEQITVRLEPDTSGFMTGRPSGRGELRGWLSPMASLSIPSHSSSPLTASRPRLSTSSSPAGSPRWS